MFISNFAPLFLLCSLASASQGNSAITLSNIPKSPYPLFQIIIILQVNSPTITAPGNAASQFLDRRLASFSFELAYFPDFAGNATHPNILTQELMNRLVERTGVGPDVRPGGITVCENFFGKL